MPQRNLAEVVISGATSPRRFSGVAIPAIIAIEEQRRICDKAEPIHALRVQVHQPDAEESGVRQGWRLSCSRGPS